jgi:hypothetical protein
VRGKNRNVNDQGAASETSGIHPKKKPRGATPSHDGSERNARVSSDWVLVENVLGRSCPLWRILHATFKWDEGACDKVSRMRIALTNYHVHINPLRTEDCDFY